ncbi:MAG: hypothetical protein KGR98_01785 [Verrucomicrobia bacterium]|nr:hypothetical protein [Verrucomicrobiota bacterium]MDE3098470.1 hypothetical protein [Verrucomicrobiota bacterium]
MTKWFSAGRLACMALAAFWLTGATAHAAKGGLRLEVQLVLGVNQPEQGHSHLRSVARDIEKKLKHLPLKWKYYYVVSGKKISIGGGRTRDVDLSQNCRVSIKNLGAWQVEVTLTSGGVTVGRITESLHHGHLLVAGAGAENSFVVLWSH